MNLTEHLAGWKRRSMLLLALASLRVAERTLRLTFKGFRAGYVPLGVLRAASHATGRLRRLSLHCWGASRDAGRRAAAAEGERRKPLPECLTRLLAPPTGGTSHTPARH